MTGIKEILMNPEVALVLSLLTHAQTSMKHNQQQRFETDFYAAIGKQLSQQENNLKSVTLHKNLSIPEDKKPIIVTAKL